MGEWGPEPPVGVAFISECGLADLVPSGLWSRPLPLPSSLILGQLRGIPTSPIASPSPVDVKVLIVCSRNQLGTEGVNRRGKVAPGDSPQLARLMPLGQPKGVGRKYKTCTSKLTGRVSPCPFILGHTLHSFTERVHQELGAMMGERGGSLAGAGRIGLSEEGTGTEPDRPGWGGHGSHPGRESLGEKDGSGAELQP